MVSGLINKNIGLKLVALLIALVSWFYIISELKREPEEELAFLKRVLPTNSMIAKKLTIMPIFIGRIRPGFDIVKDKVVVAPEYCIVVGAPDLVGKLRNVYTMPIDITGVSKPFTKSVPLNPIAPGVYMEETLVQVTIPVERREE